MSVEEAWQSIDAALIRMRRLLHTPQAHTGDGVDLSAVLVVDTIARRAATGHQTRIIDIATDLSVKPSTASRLVASTCTAGYIDKFPAVDDPRSTVLRLTPTGAHLNATATRYRLDVLKQAVPGWDVETVTTFARLLDEFSRATITAPPS